MNELYHFGIKGMRWGVRRYQNKDGTLTPLGKKHRDTALESVNRKLGYDKAASDESKSDYNYVKKAGGNASELAELGNEYLNNKRSEISSRLYKNAIELNELKVGIDYINGKMTKAGTEKLNKIWNKEKVESILNKEDKQMIESVRKHKDQINKDIKSLHKIKDKDLRDLAIAEYREDGFSVKDLLDIYN